MERFVGRLLTEGPLGNQRTDLSTCFAGALQPFARLVWFLTSKQACHYKTPIKRPARYFFFNVDCQINILKKQLFHHD